MTRLLVPRWRRSVTWHAVDRRRQLRWIVPIAVVAFALVVTAAVVAVENLPDDVHRSYLSTSGWPLCGSTAGTWAAGSSKSCSV